MSLRIEPRPTYGISRIDQPEKHNHGYYVRVTHRGTTHQKFFADKLNGGKRKALAAAREYRNEVLAKMPKYKQERAAQKKRRIPQCEVTGVTHVLSKAENGKTYSYWQAAWKEPVFDRHGDVIDEKRRTSKFSIPRYKDKAMQMAIKARRAAEREFPQ